MDIIAEREGTVAFVEVKLASDGSATMALEKIDPAKMERLVHAARAFLARVPAPDETRFDVAVVGGRPGALRLTGYLEDAFRP